MGKNKNLISLFITGFLMNFFLRFSWLLIASVLLGIIGIFFKPCIYVGLLILGLDIIISLVHEILICRTLLKKSDNPTFAKFQDAILSDGDYKDNVKEFVEETISNPQNKIRTENEKTSLKENIDAL